MGCLAGALIASAAAQTAMPDAPSTAPKSYKQTPAEAAAAAANKTPAQIAAEKEAERISKLVIINGRPYDQPSDKDKFFDYLRDSYGLPAFLSTTVRSTYAQGRGKPSGWGQDWPGFGQRFGSAAAVTAIDGNVRFAMEEIFNEDLRYIPCHGCSAKKKIENALLAEITARHDETGRRFFTLTPVVADFSGPLVANTFWTPNHDPVNGVIAARLIFATRLGQHLFHEFVWERRHKDLKIE